MNVHKLGAAVKEFLSGQPFIKQVRNEIREPVSGQKVEEWEAEHSVSMPEDLKSFFLSSNGFALEWESHERIAKGSMRINSLENLREVRKALAVDHHFLLDAATNEHALNDWRAFELERANCGTLAMGHSKETGWDGIWLRRRDGQWEKLFDGGFTEYFRLMVTQLGVPNWQLLFSRVGMDGQSSDWWWLLRPDQICLDAATMQLVRVGANDRLAE